MGGERHRGHKVKLHPRSRVISRDDDSLLLLYIISIIGGGRLLWKPFPYFEEGGGEVGGRLAKEPLYPLQSTPQFPGQEWSQGKMTHRQCSPLLYVSMMEAVLVKNLSHLSKKEDPPRRGRGWWPACEGTSHPLQSTPQLRSDHPADHPSVLYALCALDDCFFFFKHSLYNWYSITIDYLEPLDYSKSKPSIRQRFFYWSLF